jgi:hypothetical protein
MLRVYYEGRRPFELVKGPNTREAITEVMASSISIKSDLVCYGRFGLSTASETAKPVTTAETPTAVIRK